MNLNGLFRLFSNKHKRSVGNCNCDKNKIAKHCWEALGSQESC